MEVGAPKNPRQLDAQVAKRFAVVGLLSTTAAGVGSYLIAMRDVEHAAPNRITASARHFDRRAMRELLENGRPCDHSDFEKSLDDTRVFRVRFFEP